MIPLSVDSGNKKLFTERGIIMPHKGRLSVEEKAEIVKGYIRGENSYYGYSKQYGVNRTTIMSWVMLYQARELTELVNKII